MSGWTLLHAGALGDLCLALQLMLQVPGVRRTGLLRIISRVDPGDLSNCNPALLRVSSAGLGLHWMHTPDAAPPPTLLAAALGGAHIVSFLSGPESDVHARLAALRPRALYSVDPVCTASEPPHIVERWKRGLASQGLQFESCIYERRGIRLHVPPEFRAAGRNLLARAAGGLDPGPLILISPGSGGRRKCWPLDAFVRVAEHMRGAGLSVVFLTGPAESDWWGAAEFEQLRAAGPVLRDVSPTQLAHALAAADVWLGNDAGPGHLAALLGIPTVSIFGPTASAVWRPLSAQSIALQGDPGLGSGWGVAESKVIEIVARLAAAAT